MPDEVLAHAQQRGFSLLESEIRTTDIALPEEQCALPDQTPAKGMFDMLVERVGIAPQEQEDSRCHTGSFQHCARVCNRRFGGF